MEPDKEVFITLYPKEEKDIPDVSAALNEASLPVAEEAQFAGGAAIETAMKYGRASIELLATIIRKLVDADRIKEVKIEVGEKRVVLKGLAKDDLEPVEQFASRILAQLQE